ncbi:pseudouridine-5'-phosphate glycosidase [Spongisporangium articulatum]|uniref:Pseudouridine-5'-phosphate glycosidase n=1 Tax=Spongisporangium articulatum TaxID=3362603 RepID=A0ABW8AMP4_9ACTN
MSTPVKAKKVKRELLHVDPEVAEALAADRPVVALESTIISHGMPYPQNLETAREVEQTVRDGGAVPATIAVLDGQLRVGLDPASLDRLARPGEPGEETAKASRRDLPVLLSSGRTAGTTVAATMFIANLAGVGVFATGGIGGVHRGAEQTYDVSADLLELAQTPVTVVCAGAKSLLDLPKTLELLETHSVPVLGYGTTEFPAFFSRTSGLFLDHQVDDVSALAAAVEAHRELRLRSGILVANPVPEADAIPAAEIDGIIEQAVTEADDQGVKGKDVTPFLLARINELTGGRSLVANIALVKNNAALAAALASELALP